MTLLYTSIPRTILWLIPGGGSGGVEIAPFYLSKVPVTNEQFEAFDPGYQRSEASPDDQGSALGISWADASEYCRWYASLSRKAMRLPTEAEWEWVASGGTGDLRRDFESLERMVWHAGNSSALLPPVDSKEANEFGVFGVLGGVWEWIGVDWETTQDAPRVLRGGSWLESMETIVAMDRRLDTRGDSIRDAGFRVAKSLRGA